MVEIGVGPSRRGGFVLLIASERKKPSRVGVTGHRCATGDAGAAAGSGPVRVEERARAGVPTATGRQEREVTALPPGDRGADAADPG
jgi:hypothetical protein